MAEWDGLLGWFLQYTTGRPALTSNASIRQWHRAARLVAAAG
jgi:hypothetical protein